MRQTMSMGLLTVVMSFYISMDFISANFVTLHKIDEKVRSSHARELLGSGYFESNAEQARNFSVNEKILQQFKKRLPAAYQKHATDYTNIVIEESLKQNIDPVLVMAIISVESRFNPKAKGTSGEMGLMQIMPTTAAWISKKTGYSYKGGKSLYKPEVNIAIGVRYIAHLRKSFKGEGYRYIAAYNMGAANVRRLIAKKTRPKIYSKKVMSNYNKMYSMMVAQETTSGNSWRVAGE